MGKTTPAFWAFWKNVVFAIAKLLIHFSKMVEFSRGNQVYFWWRPVLVLHSEFCPESSRDFFPLSHLISPCASATCDLSSPKGFLWSLANTIARPWCFASALDSPGCWLWSQDYMVWPILAAATLHPPHLCESESSYFQFVFWCKRSLNPLEWLQASCRQPNLALKDG